MNIIAANNWKRPIYFTNPFGELGFGQYLRKDGLAYRLIPVPPKYPQLKWVADSTFRKLGSRTQVGDMNDSAIYKNLITSYQFGGANKKGVYYDEENRRHLLDMREIFAEAAGNLADEGEIDKAQKLLDKAEAGISTDNLPYAMVSRYGTHDLNGLIYLEACYKAGKKDLAEKVRIAIRKDLEDQKRYYAYMRDDNPELYSSTMSGEDQNNNAFLIVLDAVESRYAPQTQPKPQVEGNPSTIINSPKDSVPKPDTPK
ncbi:MAG: hypothetical protein WDN26_23520 [Chitinophagaceae bacterium]